LFSVVITVLYYLVICNLKCNIASTPLFKIAFKTIGIGLVVGITTYVFITPLINSLFKVFLVAILTAFVYCFACWFLRVFNIEEKQSLKQLFMRIIPI